MKVFDDIDDKIFVFESLYNQVLNDHAPIKQFQMRGNQTIEQILTVLHTSCREVGVLY